MKLNQEPLKNKILACHYFDNDEAEELSMTALKVLEKSFNEHSRFIHNHNSIQDVSKMILDSYTLNLVDVIENDETVLRIEKVYDNRYDYSGHTVTHTKGEEIYNTLSWTLPIEFIQQYVCDELKKMISN